MSAVALDQSSTTGHALFPPTTVQSTASKVVINGKPPILNGDPMATHCDPDTCHGASAVASQSTVFVNGKPVVLVGDGTSCGDTISQGSSNVFIG